VLAWLVRIFGWRNRRRNLDPDPYRAFVIGLDGLAVAVHSIIAGHDDEALEKAMQLQGELRVELWCGTRKVADVPAA
jgi:hypothetical protein